MAVSGIAMPVANSLTHPKPELNSGRKSSRKTWPGYQKRAVSGRSRLEGVNHLAMSDKG